MGGDCSRLPTFLLSTTPRKPHTGRVRIRPPGLGNHKMGRGVYAGFLSCLMRNMPLFGEIAPAWAGSPVHVARKIRSAPSLRRPVSGAQSEFPATRFARDPNQQIRPPIRIAIGQIPPRAGYLLRRSVFYFLWRSRNRRPHFIKPVCDVLLVNARAGEAPRK